MRRMGDENNWLLLCLQPCGFCLSCVLGTAGRARLTNEVPLSTFVSHAVLHLPVCSEVLGSWPSGVYIQQGVASGRQGLTDGKHRSDIKDQEEGKSTWSFVPFFVSGDIPSAAPAPV